MLPTLLATLAVAMVVAFGRMFDSPRMGVRLTGVIGMALAMLAWVSIISTL